MDLSAFAIDGMIPQRVESPTTIEDLARIVADAAKENAAISAWGGGTMQTLGNSPLYYNVALQISRLNQVIEYSPDDLIITIQAGMTITQVQKQLAAHNQFLPLDPPRAERATIGGVLATDASGALRLRFGPARDFTLGMRVVNAHGTLIKCGGKVVKNVAGYEMTKLYIGSLGTLALIAEATFKVFPKPQEEITFVAAFATLGDADATARTLWNLTTAPLALELFDSQIARGLGFETKASEWMIAARFGGTQSLARAALDKAIRAAKENNTREFAEARRASLWDDIANLPITLRDQNPRGAIVRVASAPARVCETIELILQCAHANSIEPKLFAHARAGIIHVGLDGEIEILKKTIAELRAARAPNPASVVIEAAPRALKEKISVWGEAGAAHFLNQRIKKQFDPQNIFNPGRFVGGL